MKKKSNGAIKKRSNGTIQKYRGEIIVGLITSAIWFFVEWLIKSAPKTGRNILATIQNLIYSCASSISASSLLVLLFCFVIGAFIAFAISPFLMDYYFRKSKKEIDEYERKLNEKLDRIEEETNINKKQELLKEFITEKEPEEKQKKVSKFPVILAILYVLFSVITIVIPTNLSKAFERDIKMIKPYSDEETVMLLESDWTRMKSKADYDKIYETINHIKEENNLPKQ